MKKEKYAEIIEIYSKSEKEGLKGLTNSAIMGFQPYYWSYNGFPTRIKSIEEIWRYHDSMQDNRYLWNKKCIENCSIENKDLTLLDEVKEKIYKFSVEFNFPYKSPAINALTRAFYQYLRIKRISNINKNKPTVLELGPGCGYLGILLLLSGYKYIALESTQAFYIYQNCLWKSIFKDNYNNGIDEYRSESIRHIPWWEFNKLNYKFPDFELFTANHVLSEMHPIALNKILDIFNNNSNFSLKGFIDGMGHEHTSYNKVFLNLSRRKIDILEIYPGSFLINKSFENKKGRIKKIGFKKYLTLKVNNLLRRKIFNSRLIPHPIYNILKKIFSNIDSSNYSSNLNIEKKLNYIFKDFLDFKTPDSKYLNSID